MKGDQKKESTVRIIAIRWTCEGGNGLRVVTTIERNWGYSDIACRVSYWF